MCPDWTQLPPKRHNTPGRALSCRHAITPERGEGYAKDPCILSLCPPRSLRSRAPATPRGVEYITAPLYGANPCRFSSFNVGFCSIFQRIFTEKTLLFPLFSCRYYITRRKSGKVFLFIFYTSIREVKNHHQVKRIASWRRYFLCLLRGGFPIAPRLLYGCEVCCGLGSLYNMYSIEVP